MFYSLKLILMTVVMLATTGAMAGVVWQSLGANGNDYNNNEIIEPQAQAISSYQAEVRGTNEPNASNYIPNERNAFRLSMIKKDRKISQLSLVNGDLKTRVNVLQRRVIDLSRQLQKTAKISLRKTSSSASKKELKNQLVALETKIKRIRINDNVRCWKFKGLVEKHNINTDIKCQAL